MSKDIIDIEAAVRLKGFSFRISSRVKGTKTGIHKSPHKGVSPDFLEYKEYSHGDELKYIDWRLYGRLDRLYVKKFEDEVNLKWWILIDRSASMGYGSEKQTKLDYAVRLSATLAYLLLKQGDAVGIADFHDKDVNIVPPRAGTANLNSLLERLVSLDPIGRTDIKDSLSKAVEKIGGDSAFVVISDFLTDLDLLEESIKLLGSAGKETIVFHVLDPMEISFNFDGSVEFEDMEDKTRVLVETRDIRNTYRKRVNEFIRNLELICLENRSRYVLSPSGTPIKDILIQIADR
jgi:Uncharacterized conserved protein (some members contain a von Willebrand factor type A (vWA) domain)